MLPDAATLSLSVRFYVVLSQNLEAFSIKSKLFDIKGNELSLTIKNFTNFLWLATGFVDFSTYGQIYVNAAFIV